MFAADHTPKITTIKFLRRFKSKIQQNTFLKQMMQQSIIQKFFQPALFCRLISNSPVAFSKVQPTTSVDESLTIVNQKDGVRVITLNQPKKCNPLSMQMMESIEKSLNEDICDKNLRCIILNAKGSIWSAGHDLKELAASSPSQQHEIFNKLTDIIFNIQNAPVPVIAQVNGLAAAAGCQLVSSCDMVIASDKSTFSTPGAKFGIFCSTPSIALARSMNSRSKAAYMLLTSMPINAQEAYEAGLITRLVAEADIDLEIERLVAAIKMQSRAVVAFGKKFFYKQLSMRDLNEAYTAGSQAMVDNLQMTDGKEGLESFKQKRKPNWKHT